MKVDSFVAVSNEKIKKNKRSRIIKANDLSISCDLDKKAITNPVKKKIINTSSIHQVVGSDRNGVVVNQQKKQKENKHYIYSIPDSKNILSAIPEPKVIESNNILNILDSNFNDINIKFEKTGITVSIIPNA